MKRLLVLVLGIVAVALAQNGERARKELETTDRIIEQARPFIEESGNRDAQRLFEEGERVQAEAWEMYRQRRYVHAGARTGWARDLVERALKLAKFDPKRVGDEIRKTADIMNEARPIVARSGIPRALDLWRVAEGEQETARRSFEQRKYLLAMKFTFAARVHTRKALEIVKRHGSPELVAKEVEWTGALLERAKTRLVLAGDDHRAQDLLLKAGAWQDEAIAALKAGQFPKALKLTFAARDLLLRAWEMVRGAADPELVEQAVAETDRLIEQWSGTIKEQGGEEARGLLGRAMERQQSACQLLAAKRYRIAGQETALARRLLNRAIEMVSSEEVLPGPGKDRQDED